MEGRALTRSALGDGAGGSGKTPGANPLVRRACGLSPLFFMNLTAARGGPDWKPCVLAAAKAWRRCFRGRKRKFRGANCARVKARHQDNSRTAPATVVNLGVISRNGFLRTLRIWWLIELGFATGRRPPSGLSAKVNAFRKEHIPPCRAKPEWVNLSTRRGLFRLQIFLNTASRSLSEAFLAKRRAHPGYRWQAEASEGQSRAES
jgi:hypothetical protein